MTSTQVATGTAPIVWSNQEVWFALTVHKDGGEIYSAEITLRFTHASDSMSWEANFYLPENHYSHSLDVTYFPTTQSLTWRLWRDAGLHLLDHKTIDLNTGGRKLSDPVIFGRREELRLRINTRLKLT